MANTEILAKLWCFWGQRYRVSLIGPYLECKTGPIGLSSCSVPKFSLSALDNKEATDAIETSCCSTDSERPYRCCHLPNKVENIDHTPNVLCTWHEPEGDPQNFTAKVTRKYFEFFVTKQATNLTEIHFKIIVSTLFTNKNQTNSTSRMCPGRNVLRRF